MMMYDEMYDSWCIKEDSLMFFLVQEKWKKKKLHFLYLVRARELGFPLD